MLLMASSHIHGWSLVHERDLRSLLIVTGKVQTPGKWELACTAEVALWPRKTVGHHRQIGRALFIATNDPSD
jgi:hypothetical protein